MQRKRRRLWTWLVSALALCAVLAATLSAAFNFAVSAVPSYRSKLEARVAEAANRPVRIGAMSLVWHRLRPVIQLDDVAVLDSARGQPLLQARRVRIGFSFTRLIVANWMPSRAEVSGLALHADVDKVGHWTFQGIDFSQPGGDSKSTLEQLGKLLRFSLDDCSLEIRDASLGGKALLFHLRSAELHHRDQHFDVQVAIDPPATLAQRVDLHGSFDGDLQNLNTFAGRWIISVFQLRGWPWLAKDLPDGVGLKLDGVQLTLDGRAEAGRVKDIRVAADAGRVAAQRDGKDLATVSQLRFAATAQPTEDCWQVSLEKLEMQGVHGDWSAGGGRYRCTQAGNALAYAAQVDHLRLDDLAPWLALYRGLPSTAARVHDLVGDLKDVSVATHPADVAATPTPTPTPSVAASEIQVAATLQAVGLAGEPGQNVFSGLNGTLTANREGGDLHLGGTPLSVQLPDAFSQPLAVDALAADLHWQHAGDSWQLSAPSLSLQVAGATATGSLELKHPTAEGASNEIALSLRFSAPDVLPLKPYIPKSWGDKTGQWLNAAIVHARVPSGSLELKGPLADFPFVEHPDGRYALDIDVADGVLKFSPDWPQGEQMHARLQFRGHGMAITVDQATLSGNPVDRIQADIADFRDSDLSIAGTIHGDAAKFYEIIRTSPIHAKLSGLVDKTDASGEVKLDLHLDLPLKTDPLQVRSDGVVTVEKAQLDVHGLDRPVRDVQGVVNFNAKGLSADSLTATFYEAALAARIVPQPGVPEGELEVSAHPFVEPPDGVAAAFIPEWIRHRLSGAATVRLSLPLGGPEAGRLLINSDLVGLGSQLPAPLAKAADAAQPITVRVASDGQVPLRIGLELGDALQVAIRFAEEGDGKLASRGVQVLLGPGGSPRAEADGLIVTGAPTVLDALPWLQLIGDIGGNARAGNDQPIVSRPERTAAAATTNEHLKAAHSLAFVSLDLTPLHLLLRGGSLSRPHLRASPQGAGYHVSLDGDSAQGTIDWSPADNGHVVARLDHLVFEGAPPEPASPPPADGGKEAAAAPDAPPAEPVPEAKTAPFEPTQAPTLDLSCDRLAVGEILLGRLTLSTSRIPDGQKLDSIGLSGGTLDIDAHGGWRRVHEESNADFDFTIKSPDIGPVLGAFGYAKTIDAKQAKFSGTLAWARNADGLALADAVGLIQLDLKNGVLKTVRPGAGRVLGLLNLYALPRRLLFDFRDVVSKGLAFDSIEGKFSLANGQAYTSDMEIRSPSLRVALRGRIGLVEHDYDQHVTVYPDVTTGVTIGAAIAGGPVGALIALVAQEVLGKPFNKLTKFSYHVTGPWDNPVVKHGKDDAPAPAEPNPEAAAPVAPAGQDSPESDAPNQ